MKIIRSVVLAVLALAVLFVATVFVLGGRSIARTIEVPPEAFSVGPADSARLAEGNRLASIYQCRNCHGEDLAGTDFIKGMPFLNLPAPNLTAGRPGEPLSDAHWERAVRHGIGPDGRTLLIMPTEGYTGLSNEDLGAIVAYARSLPPVETVLIGRSAGPAGRAAALFAPKSIMPALLIDHARPHPAAVAAGSEDRGEYLAQACRACHGLDLGGMTLSFADDILAPDLTRRNAAGMSGWTEAEFVRGMQGGVRPDGRVLSDVMPWRAFGRYSPEELGALWRYLRVAPSPTP